jgi:GT2 family glycosyltransferase
MTNKKISLLLPSLREELVKKRIKQWNKTNSNVDFEIVLVSPFEIKEENVFWIKENKCNGSVDATNVAYAFSRGEYVIYFSDDVEPTKDCLKNMLEFMEKQNKTPFLGAFKMINDFTGREIGPFGCYNMFYACYGCVSKESLRILNNILFNPKLLYSWADIDLSLRIYDKKGEVKKCDEAIVIPHQIEDEIYKSHRNTFENDFNIFADIWHRKLGKNLPKVHGEINKKIR